MIRFEAAARRFPGAARPAVDALDLTVAEGTTCALVGPSGCGKSTAMRMVNRLVAPDSGRVLLNGRNVAEADPVVLRRGIGYVLQGIGLFPHRSVGQNVATVPQLLGWPRRRVAERVEAMLDLVGLDPGTFRDRLPATLSGGQRQRVGVARALAADPPVLLMDEPFGAVDPAARVRLRAEIAAILRRVSKTVLLVTHDLDEAVTMGDTLALMRDGRLVQSGAPDGLLADPADAFAACFLGKDRALRRLALLDAHAHGEPGPGEGLPTVAPNASLREALAAMLAAGTERVALSGTAPQAIVTWAAIRAALAPGTAAFSPPPRDPAERSCG